MRLCLTFTNIQEVVADAALVWIIWFLPSCLDCLMLKMHIIHLATCEFIGFLSQDLIISLVCKTSFMASSSLLLPLEQPPRNRETIPKNGEVRSRFYRGIKPHWRRRGGEEALLQLGLLVVVVTYITPTQWWSLPLPKRQVLHEHFRQQPQATIWSSWNFLILWLISFRRYVVPTWERLTLLFCTSPTHRCLANKSVFTFEGRHWRTMVYVELVHKHCVRTATLHMNDFVEFGELVFENTHCQAPFECSGTTCGIGMR